MPEKGEDYALHGCPEIHDRRRQVRLDDKYDNLRNHIAQALAGGQQGIEALLCEASLTRAHC